MFGFCSKKRLENFNLKALRLKTLEKHLTSGMAPFQQFLVKKPEIQIWTLLSYVIQTFSTNFLRVYAENPKKNPSYSGSKLFELKKCRAFKIELSSSQNICKIRFLYDKKVAFVLNLMRFSWKTGMEEKLCLVTSQLNR